MDERRRRFLKWGAVAGVGLSAGAAALGVGGLKRPHVRWDQDEAAPFGSARFRVWRGPVPVGTQARLRVLLDADDGAGERPVEEWTLTLDDTVASQRCVLSYPYPELRDASLRYRLALQVDGFGEVTSEALRVDVLRYRFGC